MIIGNVNQLLNVGDWHIFLGVLLNVEDHHVHLVNRSKVHVCAL